MQAIKTLLFFLLLSTTAACANDRFVLHHDSPANDKNQVTRGKRKKPAKFGFMQAALPLGNGRLGAMFSGGIETEHLMLNDITLWMNAKRGLDAKEQSGAHSVTPEDFEKVRKAYRDEKYGSAPDSMEGISTKYLSSKLPLGNYGPFTDVWIATGHAPKSVTNYRRALDCRTGLGSVSYSIGDGQFNREVFCSFPYDVVGTRYTAENATLNLVVKTQTKHVKGRQVIANGNRIVLTSQAKMQPDDVKFMQVIHIDAVDGEVAAEKDASVTIAGATDVRIYVADYTDYLPTYPRFKGRDFKGDSERSVKPQATTIAEAAFVAYQKDADNPKHFVPVVPDEALASEEELYERKPQAFANPKVDNPDLPNVLLIGDSISIGYTPHVRRKLAGKADVYRITGNAQTSSYGVKNLDKWLTRKPANWDVIHFNWGLWDLCYRHPKSKVQGHRDKVNGTVAVTLAQYQANMEKNVTRLKATKAKLIWCTTTPVPEKEAGRKVGDELKYNLIAAGIMKANGVLINDLHSHALSKGAGIMSKEGDVHFNELGYQHLADKVVTEILSVIEE